MVASARRETTAVKLIVIYVADVDGNKLSNQAPSVKSKLNGTRYSSTQ